MEPKSDIFDKTIVIAGFILTISAIIVCFYIYYYKKDFDFIVEASCDASKQSCYTRNCDVDGCPPNNLSVYKVFHLNAADFGSCSDDTCIRFCQQNPSKCLETMCGDDPADTCALATTSEKASSTKI
jgi:hypothetical protein